MNSQMFWFLYDLLKNVYNSFMNKKNMEWFKKFVEICEKNNLWYMVFYGTLIGTIREKGPIEWDDDFDIVMKPESYEKLKELYPKNCLDNATLKKYPWAFPKFVPDPNDLFSNNIFVDIFLIINSNKKRIKKFHSKRIKFLYQIHSARMDVIRNKKKVWWVRILGGIARCILPKFSMIKAIKILKNTDNSDNVTYILNTPLITTKALIYPFPINKLVKKKFLDYYVNVPENYHAILTQEYGDYMIPINEYNTHTNVLY